MLEDEKECLYCGKVIKKHAIRCRFCKMYQTQVPSEIGARTKEKWFDKVIKKITHADGDETFE